MREGREKRRCRQGGMEPTFATKDGRSVCNIVLV